MADPPNGPPPLNPAATQGGRTLPTQPPQHPHKRQNRHRKHHSQSIPQVDGTVSDSVTTASHSAKAPKQRHQSAAMHPVPQQNGHAGQPNVPKPRPVSIGGNMIPATPLKEQAYAGATFQASPAPSSLPVPKFFSRSVPNVANQSLAARMDGDTTTENEDSSPEPEVVSPQPPSRGSQKSPLDFFFDADREEKEKSRSSSMLSPEMAMKQPVPATQPRLSQQYDKNIFLSELDGDNGIPSPQTMPHIPKQRPTSSPNVRVPGSNSESEREAYSKSLKDLLFNNINSPPPQVPTPPHTQTRARSNPRTPDAVFESPSPFQRSSSGPSTPTPSTQQQNHYSLHYGNRNLSPLFKAAQRNDTPSRPSGLRQQELASDVAPMGMPPSGSQGAAPIIDPNTFSRNYIDQHVRNSPSATLPHLPGMNPPPQQQSHFPPGIPTSYYQQGVPAGVNNNTYTTAAPAPAPPPASSPRTTGQQNQPTQNHDIKGMEDDLRRMLNLNVLSS